MKSTIRSTTAILLLCGAFAVPSRLSLSADAPSESRPFRLIGTAIFQGDASALVEVASTGEQRFVNLNDALEGYKVREIKPDQVVLQSGAGQSLVLASADQAPVAQLAVHEPITILDPMKIEKQAPTPAFKSPSNRGPRSEVNSSSVPGLMIPIDGRVVSGFGSRKDPWGGGTKFHAGVDIAAPQGTIIRAAADGVVEEAGTKALLGNNVKIDHRNGYETIYGHMYRFVVHEGQEVSRGDVIGYEGSTGHSTGPHLHFEIHHGGQPIDPGTIIPTLEK